MKALQEEEPEEIEGGEEEKKKTLKEEEEEEEEDYMSSAVLEEANRIAASRKQTPAELRKLRLRKQQEDQLALPSKKTRKEKEAETREAGLEKPIPKENIGFQLLQKMGYVEGAGLGSQLSGRVEPIKVTVKEGRQGIGKEEEQLELKRKREEEAEDVRKRQLLVQENRAQDFKGRVRDKYQNQMTFRFIKECRIACEQLDKKEGIEKSPFWFQPRKKKPLNEYGDEVARGEISLEEEEEEAEEEEEENKFELLEPPEQLQQLTEYLRSHHRFCVYCGEVFEDEDALSSNCPGNSEDLH